MSIVKSEFALALNQVATERGISADDVLDSIEAAILAAYKKEIQEHSPTLATQEEAEDQFSNILVKLNRDTGEAHILEDEKDITPPGFGRIAAQTAKQVILQKIREAEKKTVITHYKSQIGTVTRGRVIRYDGYNAFVDIGKVEAILPKEEQIKQEKYNVNTSLLFYIKDIGEDKFGNSKIIISRTDPQLIAELFKREVPEIANGTVEIRQVVREPGERAKIAVFSQQSGVDPVGACVGQKGVRVQTITNEFGGMEKIDIIQWSRDEKLFIMAALSPAKITDIELDGEKKHAKVSVEESQTPLAIGKSGINVNLASRLTGYTIDIIQIKSETQPAVEETKKVEEEGEEKEAAPKEVEGKQTKLPEGEEVKEDVQTSQDTVQDSQEAVATPEEEVKTQRSVQTQEETVETPEATQAEQPSEQSVSETSSAENQAQSAVENKENQPGTSTEDKQSDGENQ